MAYEEFTGLITNGDESAYPNTKNVGEVSISEGGLTKREYFAIHVLAGILSNHDYENRTDYFYQAVQHADRLIERLNEHDE